MQLNVLGQMIRVLYLIIWGLFVTACSHQLTKPFNMIPTELIGAWSSEDGCYLTFSKEQDALILVEFNNLHHNKFSHLPLSCVKNGIMIQFNSHLPAAIFNGTFVEGELVVNNYCKSPLHKISN